MEITRKIVVIGNSQGVTLPRHQLKKIDAKIGDEVRVKYTKIGADTQ